MKRHKIAIITNIPAPYRTAQWEHFAETEDLDITVYYCARSVKGRFWKLNSAKGVKEIFLKGFSFKGLHFNPGIVKIVFKKFDVLAVGGYGYPSVIVAILLLKLLRKPYVMIIDGIAPQTIDTPQDKLVTRLRAFFITGASAYSANGTIGRLLCQSFGIPDYKIFNQFMTVDVDSYVQLRDKGIEGRNKLRARLAIDEATTVVLYCGRLVKHKGVQDLIETVGMLRKAGSDIIALIVGDGILRKELEQLSELSGNSAVFVGHIDPQELYQWYYASDIFVLPTYRDPWGLVVNEAMACSLPVVVTNAAGCYLDLVAEKRNGFIFKAGDLEELSKALRSLMDPELRKQYGQESLKMIMGWSYKESSREFRKMVSSLSETRSDNEPPYSSYDI